jgi:hypothetical protein
MIEVYAALDADNRRLALMGARAMLDLFMSDEVGEDVRGFTRKLAILLKNRYITETQKSFMEAAINAGNAAVHEGYKPSLDDLHGILDIVENLLQKYSLVKTSASIDLNTLKRNNGNMSE